MQFNKSLKLIGIFILLLVVITVFAGCGGTVSEETKIENVVTKFFQAISDRDWDKARSYCVYNSQEYNDVIDLEEEWDSDFGESEEYDLVFIVDDVNPIIVTGGYAEATVYLNFSWFYNGEPFYWGGEEEDITEPCLFYLQKVGSNWKIYEQGW